mmetsp:Transcript_4997/g.13279  ORF Transcript_4997/g.13279 Transcript_4997/m.13279 type:complete len:203 (-) Transcript_4997:70-678(-)
MDTRKGRPQVRTAKDRRVIVMKPIASKEKANGTILWMAVFDESAFHRLTYAHNGLNSSPPRQGCALNRNRHLVTPNVCFCCSSLYTHQPGHKAPLPSVAEQAATSPSPLLIEATIQRRGADRLIASSAFSGLSNAPSCSQFASLLRLSTAWIARCCNLKIDTDALHLLVLGRCCKSFDDTGRSSILNNPPNVTTSRLIIAPF